jgi:DNA-binding response OmpR family regulator
MAATIVCVDDEENQLMLRKLMLERAGYHVLTATMPAQAIDLFRDNAIDLVIVDYYMPGMNGLTLARELRQQKKVPIVVLSAYAELEGESIGIADMWIMKGTAAAELLAKIAELLAKRIPHVDQSGGVGT